MPKDYAENAVDARKKLKTLLEDAYISSIPEEYNITEKKIVFKPTFGDAEEYTVRNIEGGVCPTDEQVCRFVYEDAAPIENYKTPTWLPYTESYFWSFGEETPYAAARITRAKRGYPTYTFYQYTAFYTHEYLKEVSSKLPEWIYIYSPALHDRQYPVIYNQGKVLYFIKPELPTKEET